MATKIKQIEIVKSVGCAIMFRIGGLYNDLGLVKIQDESVEFKDSLVSIYRGYTDKNEMIFETINAPVVVEFE